jgi:hypothetical protein
MEAPVSFTLSVVPKGERSTEGRVLLRTGENAFDTRFVTRTDHPTQAKMMIGSKVMHTHIEKLCCSSKSFLTMTKGKIEQSELVIPSHSLARHTLDHIESMATLAKMAGSIPGAEAIKISPYRRERSAPIFRIALAAGAICTLIAVFVLKPTQAQPQLGDAGSNPNYAEGVDAVDALLIRDVKNWHAAEPADFDPAVRASLSHSEDLSGRVPLELDPTNREKPDVAYWLVHSDGRSRIVILRDGTKLMDTLYSDVAAMARVPQESIGNIDWKERPVAAPEGDGLMLVRRSENNGYSAVVIYPRGERIYSGVPERFENVSVR